MKKFKTMTELEILNAAYSTIMNFWAKAREKVEKNPENEIAQYHVDKCWAKMKELDKEIIRLEKLAKKE